MIHREPLEWSQTWWEQAESHDLPRILLIGDSIVNGYRDGVQQHLRGQAYVDKFATSRFAADPFFQKELALYLEEYHYDCIHFNHGLHGRDFPLEEYRAAYEKTLRLLLDACPNLILALSTPITVINAPDRLDPALNPIVTGRNAAVAAFSAQYGLPLDDLYSPMLGHPEYRAADGYHYNEEGRAVQAKQAASCLLPHLAK